MKKIFLALYCLFSVFLTQAQEENYKVDLSSPFATIYSHLYFLEEEHYDETRSSYAVYGEKRKRAEEIAVKIKKVLVGKGVRFDLSEIPKNSNFLDTISGLKAQYKYILFPETVPEIYVEKIKGKWYYGTGTNKAIDKLYKDMFPAEAEYLKKLIPIVGHKKFLDVELWQYAGGLLFLLICIGLFFLFKVINFWLLKQIEKITIRFSHGSLNEYIRKLARPISLLMVFTIVERYIPVLQFEIHINVFLFTGINIAQTILWIFIGLNIIQLNFQIYKLHTANTASKLDDQLVPVVRKLLRGFVYFLGGLKMVTIFGADLSTVLAGASIGGLAVALAAQDTVKNLIGTLMIFFDKPFQIGDWIEGGGLEGTVEEVGFRSSRIRAADTSIFTIPNSKLSEIVINNKGLRLFRRYNTTLGIRYDTPPELIEIFVKGVRTIVEAHPDTRSDSYNVEFVGFGDSALQIMLNVYFKNPGWGVEQSSKHRLHMAIVRFANEIGVGFAFPSQTVMIEEFPEKKSLDLSYEISSDKADKVLKNVLKDFPETER